MPQKYSWLRRKLRRWRRTESPLKEVYPADNIVFSPPAEPNKVVESQIPVSSTRLPHTWGEDTIQRLPHSRGSAKTPDKGQRGNEDWARRAQHDIGGSSNYTWGADLSGEHVIHTTKYRSEVLQGMRTKISTVKNQDWKSANQHVEEHVEALADSGASGLIISMDLAKKVRMTIFEKGDETLKDASNKHMDVYGRGEIQEEYGTPHKIKVLISRDLGQYELVVGLEDLKDLGILHP